MRGVHINDLLLQIKCINICQLAAELHKIRQSSAHAASITRLECSQTSSCCNLFVTSVSAMLLTGHAYHKPSLSMLCASPMNTISPAFRADNLASLLNQLCTTITALHESCSCAHVSEVDISLKAVHRAKCCAALKFMKLSYVVEDPTLEVMELSKNERKSLLNELCVSPKGIESQLCPSA